MKMFIASMTVLFVMSCKQRTSALSSEDFAEAPTQITLSTKQHSLAKFQFNQSNSQSPIPLVFRLETGEILANISIRSESRGQWFDSINDGWFFGSPEAMHYQSQNKDCREMGGTDEVHCLISTSESDIKFVLILRMSAAGKTAEGTLFRAKVQFDRQKRQFEYSEKSKIVPVTSLADQDAEHLISQVKTGQAELKSEPRLRLPLFVGSDSAGGVAVLEKFYPWAKPSEVELRSALVVYEGGQQSVSLLSASAGLGSGAGSVTNYTDESGRLIHHIQNAKQQAKLSVFPGSDASVDPKSYLSDSQPDRISATELAKLNLAKLTALGISTKRYAHNLQQVPPLETYFVDRL